MKKTLFKVFFLSVVLVISAIFLSGCYNDVEINDEDIPALTAFCDNKKLKNCLSDTDFWVDALKNKDIPDLILDYIPEEAFYQITPQIYKQVDSSNLLGLSDEPIIVDISVCKGDDCLRMRKNELLGYSVVTRYRTTLVSSMSSTQDTVPVASMDTFDDHTLTMADLGSRVYLTIEPGRAKEEIVVCNGISSTTWTGCVRGLAFYGTSEESVTANKNAHNAGSVVVMSNVHYVYEQLVDKDTSNTSTAKFAVKDLTATSTLCLLNSNYCFRVNNGMIQWTTDSFANSYNFTSSTISQLTASSTKGIEVTDSKVGVNFNLNNWWFKIDTDGYFAVSTTTDYGFDNFWKNSYNATSTKETLALNNLTATTTTLINTNMTNATSSNTLVYNRLCGSSTSTDCILSNTINHTSNNPFYEIGFLLSTSTAQSWQNMTEASQKLGYSILNFNGGAGVSYIMSEIIGSYNKANLQMNTTSTINLKFRLKFNRITDQHCVGLVDEKQELYNLIGASPGKSSLSFCFEGNTLFAKASNDNVQTLWPIDGITATQWNDYSINWVEGGDANFYINNVLRQTLTTTTPSQANTAYFGIGGDGASDTAQLSEVKLNFTNNGTY